MRCPGQTDRLSQTMILTGNALAPLGKHNTGKHNTIILSKGLEAAELLHSLTASSSHSTAIRAMPW